jgi:hypothetical protein
LCETWILPGENILGSQYLNVKDMNERIIKTCNSSHSKRTWRTTKINALCIESICTPPKKGFDGSIEAKMNELKANFTIINCVKIK